MPIEITMPALSPTMTEGTLANWTKKEGDQVSAGDVIAEIETDKATMEVEAVDEGVLGKIVVKAGTENVPVNEVIALLLEEGEDKKALANWKPKAAPKKEAKEEKKSDGDAASTSDAKPAAGGGGGVMMAAEPTKAPDLPDDVTVSAQGGMKISPVALRIAEQAGINPERIQGTGPHGRIIKADVEDAIQYGGKSGHVSRNHVPFSKNPNNGMRKTIAKRLTEAKQQIPHFYLTVECEIDRLMDTRKQMNSHAPENPETKQPAYKISVNDFVIKASALAMKDVPEANASWYDDAIVQYSNVDISVAVATDGGLITPIVKNADQKALAQISAEMKVLAKKARDGKLQPEEYQGGGFSISNLGMFGVQHFAAIVNPPQACILAVGSGEEKVVKRDGEFTTVNVMHVTLSTDHRAVDGALGAVWLQAFKKYIENPVLMVE